MAITRRRPSERFTGAPRPGGSGVFQPETVLWAKAAGNVPANQLQAIDAFITGCKLDGTWNQLDYIHPFAGSSLQSALVPLKTPTGKLTPCTNNGFITTDYTPTQGLLGNGSKYLATGFASQRVANDYSLGIYYYDFRYPITASSAGTAWSMASNNSYMKMLAGSPTGQLLGVAAGSNPTASFPPKGFLLFANLGTGNPCAYGVYWQGTQIVNSTATFTLGTGNNNLFGYSGSSDVCGVIAFACFGGGLSAQQSALLSSRVEN